MKYDLTTSKSELNKGKVTTNKNILLSIINLATKEIDGVSKLTQTFGSSIKSLFSTNSYEGVKIKTSNQGIIIHVYLNVYYKVKVADVVFKVQQNIKNGLLSMIDLKINSINVHVMGVDFKKQKI